MKGKLIIAIILMSLASSMMAQDFNGVYQLFVEDQSGKEISAGTGFYVTSEMLSKPVFLTSFHLVNSVLINASKIKVFTKENGNVYLSILGYDELNDILVLDSPVVFSDPLSFSEYCSSALVVAGYHKGSFMAVSSKEGMSATKLREAKRLAVYLSKGFSGAPVLNENAEVCGMVVLSSEQNASSIAVVSAALKRSIRETEISGYSVRALRLLMGVEHIVKTQAELGTLISSKPSNAQILVKLSPSTAEDFLIRDTDNLIIEADDKVGKIVVHNSKSIMLRNLNVKRLIVNESSQIFVSNSLFDKYEKPLFVKDSFEVFVTGCVFKNTTTGVVLKASELNKDQLLNNNIFQSVEAVVSNI